MGGREITADRRAWLVGELEAWTTQGLLSGDQAKGVLGLYEGGTPEGEAARRTDRASSAVMGLGALMIGLAVLTAVAFNWQELSTSVRIALILLTLGGTYAGAWALRYRAGARTASDVVCFLGCLLYGAGIWLVAQMFNFNVTGVEGFWWWAVGVLPFALIVGTWPLHALVATTLAAYTAGAALGPALGWFGAAWKVAEPAWSVPILTAFGLSWAYARKSRSVLALYVALGTFWVLVQPSAWEFDATPIYWAGLVGAILMLIAACHPPEAGLGIPYRFLGVLLVGGVLIPLSTYAFNSEIRGQVLPTPLAIETAAAVVLAAVLFVVAADRDRRREGRGVSLGRSVLAAPGRWFPLAMLALFAALGFWNAVVDEPIATTIGANAAMASLAIWLTIVGTREDRGRPFAAGVAYFLLWAIARYLDLFSGFGGMPGAALMFLACGAGLVGAALLWRRLKEVPHAPA
ncbi:DUF2157 domain-containing protein [Paludisphaera mucosa]|uniref:DUF2157 domain-containing protein n=1 Tax=Paludisphaera mucosa TaxID=3030827 RepID=A0ABT6FIR9_9BACT|nr:DUF2157 domain-containing protein [Paludisphaera mucosa]MDG3007442.1 DUF2157 domain-containing protein [Paludisphaera mucosa]